jgi:hypothetical protein
VPVPGWRGPKTAIDAPVTLSVDRARVLAYRVAAQQLDRPDIAVDALAVLDIGVQDTPYGSAALALAARHTSVVAPPSLVPIWSVRGAPHLHRPADLPALAAALWPLSDADAIARIATTNIKEGAKLGIAAFTAAARAMRAVVTRPMPKGEVSTAVSAQVPESLTYRCRSCAAQHISVGLFQQVGVLAGVCLDRTSGDTWLAPVPGWPGVPAAAAGTADLIAAYLRLLGPATPAEAAKFLDTSTAAARPAWPVDDLVEVSVDGRRTWLPADRVDALRAAPRPDVVRLLPPSDPYLQARDRDLLVPDRARQKEVWRILGNPGALLVDGEVAGTWRPKKSGARLDLTITPFERVPARVRSAVQAEAERVAQVRGARDLRVHWPT